MGRRAIAAIALIVVAIVLTSTIMIVSMKEEEDKGLVIDGDAELRQLARSMFWKGEGSMTDPFRISGLDLNISGPGPCISISGTTEHILIEDCRLSHDLGADESYEGTAISITSSKNITINRNVITYVANGIELMDCRDLVISNNSISNGLIGLSISNTSSISVKDNDIRLNGISFNLSGLNNGKIINNTMEGVGTPLMVHSLNNEVRNNRIISTEGNGLQLEGSSYNKVEDNLVQAATWGPGMTRGYVGIILVDSHDNNLIFNEVSGAGYGAIGISIIDSDRNIVTNSIMNGRFGAYISGSDQNVFSDNDLSSVYHLGIELRSSDENIIERNRLDNIFSVSILAIDCDSNRILSNILTSISNMSFVIWLNGSSGTLVANNTIDYIGELPRDLGLAYDDTGLNVWNDTEKGNSWSDWTGPDIDSDGIVDFPYVVEGGKGAVDRLPIGRP